MVATDSQSDIALVQTSYSNTALIQLGNKSTVKARLKKKINRPVCGDRVRYITNDFGENIIHEVLPRNNELKRLVKDGKQKVFAANITQMLIVIAVEPVYSRYLIDRYIAYAEVHNITPVILLNKTDLLDDMSRPQHLEILEFYSQLGYKTLQYSKKSNNISRLLSIINDGISILVGQSGVGKSSIIKQLFPEHEIMIGELSHKTGEGTHTTTHTEYFELPGNGAIIDSPGVREFTPWFSGKNEIQYGFVEFRDYIDKCKFRNCIHMNENGCEIKQAVTEGKINKLRYNSYIDMLNIFMD